MTGPLRLRFAFEAGAGVCLWAANDDAQARFGLAVEQADLPLDGALRQTGEALIERFDTSLDWTDPAGPTPWTAGEADAFESAASAWLADLRAALGDGFEIVDAR